MQTETPALTTLFTRIACGAAERERSRRPPHDVIDLVRQARLGAVRLSVRDGGAGASLRDLFAVLIDLAAADANVAHILRAHFFFVESRLTDPNASVARRWLRRVGEGAIFGNAAAEFGTAPVGAAGLQTRLARQRDRYVLTGTKFYCTGSLYSDWIVVLATAEDDAVVRVVIPANRAGVVLEDDWDGMGQQLSGSGTVRFERVEVAPDEVLRSAQDNGAPTYLGAFAQLYLTAVIAGIMRTIRDDAAATIHGRSRTYSHGSGATAAADPLILQIAGELTANAFAAEAMVLAAAQALDVGAASVVDGVPDPAAAHDAALRAAEAKVVIDGMAQRAASRLFDVGGASAVRQSHNLDRHWRNIRTLVSHNPTPYKARAIGDLVINGTALPDNGFF
ncbi:MAG: acyl-CoA dehydrogenase family protein [Solirubrobacteraceae bacterium]